MRSAPTRVAPKVKQLLGFYVENGPLGDSQEPDFLLSDSHSTRAFRKIKTYYLVGIL